MFYIFIVYHMCVFTLMLIAFVCMSALCYVVYYLNVPSRYTIYVQ